MSGEDEWADYDSSANIFEMRLEELEDERDKLRTELQRYREREPLVLALLSVLDADDKFGRTGIEEAVALRNFKVSS